MLLPVSVYLIPLFDLIAVPLSLLLHFFFAVWRTRCLSLSPSSYLGCLALLIWVPFFRSLLRRIFFLALRVLDMIALCLFRFCLSLVSWFSFLNPFLATMSLVGYFHARFILSAFFTVCLFCFVFLRPCSFPVCFGVTSSIL